MSAYVRWLGRVDLSYFSFDNATCLDLAMVQAGQSGSSPFLRPGLEAEKLEKFIKVEMVIGPVRLQ
jgi:hypothetical protein